MAIGFRIGYHTNYSIFELNCLSGARKDSSGYLLLSMAVRRILDKLLQIRKTLNFE